MEFYNASLSLARAWEEAGSRSQALRVLEEAVRERPAYVGPGLAGAWWIKTQVQLAEAYRKAGRPQRAVTVDERLRTLLAHADPGHRELLFEPDQK